MAAAALAEVGKKSARGADDAVNVGLEHGLEFVFGDFFDGAVETVTCVVDEDVDLAEGGDGLLRD